MNTLVGNGLLCALRFACRITGMEVQMMTSLQYGDNLIVAAKERQRLINKAVKKFEAAERRFHAEMFAAYGVYETAVNERFEGDTAIVLESEPADTPWSRPGPVEVSMKPVKAVVASALKNAHKHFEPLA
jgi:hypothetical protein